MPLTQEQENELRAAIEDRQRTLLGGLREDAQRARQEQYGELAGAAPDAGDESVADLIVDLEQADLSRELAELRGIEGARGRLDDGSYGLCTDCGGEIGYARLRASPAARRCIECQRRFELTHGVERPTL